MKPEPTRVDCAVCGKEKAPWSRDVPLALYGSLCTDECIGYYEDPQPGTLWPGEEPSDDAR